MEKIKCLRWISKNKMIIDERQIPELENHEALLKVESCGICGSDLKIIRFGNNRVKSGQITGHEIAGEIIKVKNLKNFRIGDRVSVGADVPCYKCKSCISGNVNFCSENLAIGHELEGGFSQYMVLNKHTLEHGPIKKIKNLEYDLACMAEPLACCINGFDKVSFKNYNSVLIMGCGPIGLMLAFLARSTGIKKVYMTDISEDRLKLLKDFDFITDSVNTKKTKLKDWITKICENSIDLIFTANNNVNSHHEALSVLAPQTVVNFFGGLPSDTPSIPINTNQLHYQENVLTGSHGSSPKQHSLAVDLISKNRAFFKKLISKTLSITEFKEAFEIASNSKNLKVIIKPNKK